MKQNLKILIYTLLGNTMLAFAVCAFIVPQDFMLGGTSGIALTAQYFLPIRTLTPSEYAEARRSLLPAHSLPQASCL